jgi:hypothetical protein
VKQVRASGTHAHVAVTPRRCGATPTPWICFNGLEAGATA